MRQCTRRLPVGAELQPGGGTHFRVWAPDPTEISLVVERPDGNANEFPLQRESSGHAAAFAAAAVAGSRYWFRVDGELLADPVSRFQPDGPHGPSEVVDPSAFEWSDRGWRGRALRGQVIYELHPGTFSQEGTWQGAMRELAELAALGVTTIEVMPVADFPGRFGWGYDGVFTYAPARIYGRPDDFRAFVDRAHQAGLGVILDVVYNHFGPDGSVHRRFANAYFSAASNEWGDSLNFDGPGACGVREFFIANAGYWIDEFHLDGLRLDATQCIHDRSNEHVLAAIGRRAREAAGGRRIILVAENEPQHTRLVRPLDDGGYGLDALWNDDFHHTALVAATGRSEAYYSDHRGTPQELISAAKYGYLFQGQWYGWQMQPRGTPSTGLPPEAFVTFLQNHDQVANSAEGARLHQRTTPGRYRALTALFLLLPGTPMLFQGQEMAASSPFLYFADHGPELAAAVQKGRLEFLAQFPSARSADAQARLAPPHDPRTFELCKLRWDERETHAPVYRLHKDLLRLRRENPSFTRQQPGSIDGAVLGPEMFALRFKTGDPAEDRLLIVNLGPDCNASSFAEPLLAPPDGTRWNIHWSSESTIYEGAGIGPVMTRRGWHVPGHSAIVLAPRDGTDHGATGKDAR